MLLRTIFALVLFAALAERMVHGAHALAQSVLRRQALLAVHDEIAASATAARDAIARAIAAGGDPHSPDPVPPPASPTCRLRLRGARALEGSATISFTIPLSATPSPCPSGACTVYEQENDAVDEGRVDATIAAEATTPGGAVLASRSARLTFRTLRVAPFAALAGQADDSVATADDTLAADDAGATPTGAAPGTLIDVLYKNAVTGATIPANVWLSRVESPKAKHPAWSP